MSAAPGASGDGGGPPGLPTWLAFLDVKAAYDTVWHDGLWRRLWDVGVRGRCLRLLQDFYADNESCVQLGADGLSRWFSVTTGVKQGACLSPLLYALFIDPLLRELRASGHGVTVAGVYVGAIFYADDMVLMAESAAGLRAMLAIAEAYANRWRFRFAPDKCEVLVVDGPETAPG